MSTCSVRVCTAKYKALYITGQDYQSIQVQQKSISTEFKPAWDLHILNVIAYTSYISM